MSYLEFIPPELIGIIFGKIKGRYNVARLFVAFDFLNAERYWKIILSDSKRIHRFIDDLFQEANYHTIEKILNWPDLVKLTSREDFADIFIGALYSGNSDVVELLFNKFLNKTGMEDIMIDMIIEYVGNETQIPESMSKFIFSRTGFDNSFNVNVIIAMSVQQDEFQVLTKLIEKYDIRINLEQMLELFSINLATHQQVVSYLIEKYAEELAESTYAESFINATLDLVRSSTLSNPTASKIIIMLSKFVK